MKILDFLLFLWVIFALLDPDPDPATQINADPDPDPKPCQLQYVPIPQDYTLSKKKIFPILQRVV